jgi:hypothetical protein
LYINIKEQLLERYLKPLSQIIKAAKLFCEMNDLILNWKKITRGLPRGRRAANDRAPTLEEIQRLVEYPDRRTKPIVYTMISSGIRMGAWDYLQWKDVLPITNDNGEIITARLLVYGTDRFYYTRSFQFSSELDGFSSSIW